MLTVRRVVGSEHFATDKSEMTCSGRGAFEGGSSVDLEGSKAVGGRGSLVQSVAGYS